MEFHELYEELDRSRDLASRRAGLGCAPGCGACCRRPSRDIEASPEELAPMAAALWDEERAAEVLERARRAGAAGWCAVYEAAGEEPVPQGRCTAYPQRPLTCRLFGFSAVRLKDGRLSPLLSAVMKDRDPGLAGRVDQAAAEGALLPVAAEWRLRMAEVHPAAAVNLRPLNEALVLALEAEGLRRRFRSSGGD